MAAGVSELPIVGVFGIPRSGTSLAMQMLVAGGLDAYHDDNAPAYETDKIMRLPVQHRWLDDCRGKAVKILDPQRLRPPSAKAWRNIVLVRCAHEVARSQIKFLGLTDGIPKPSPAEFELMRRGVKRDQTKMVEFAQRCGPHLVLRFEDILSDPLVAAKWIADFLEPVAMLNVSEMADRVVDRPAGSLPFLLESYHDQIGEIAEEYQTTYRMAGERVLDVLEMKLGMTLKGAAKP